MREILDLYLRRLTKILPCSSDLSPSQQSSSSGDLLPEMMESGTPPSSVSPNKVGDAEVSSRGISMDPPGAEGDAAPRGSPRPAFEEGHGTSPAPSGVRPEELKILLGRAFVSEEHRALMNMVIEKISSTESGLHEAVKSLLAGLEVCFK